MMSSSSGVIFVGLFYEGLCYEELFYEELFYEELCHPHALGCFDIDLEFFHLLRLLD